MSSMSSSCMIRTLRPLRSDTMQFTLLCRAMTGLRVMESDSILVVAWSCRPGYYVGVTGSYLGGSWVCQPAGVYRPASLWYNNVKTKDAHEVSQPREYAQRQQPRRPASSSLIMFPQLLSTGPSSSFSRHKDLQAGSHRGSAPARLLSRHRDPNGIVEHCGLSMRSNSKPHQSCSSSDTILRRDDCRSLLGRRAMVVVIGSATSHCRQARQPIVI